jgi:hypothetical protein
VEESGIWISIICKNLNRNGITNFESRFGGELKPIKTPISEGYHPGIDDTLIFTEENSANFRSMIGCCICIIVLERFDVAYATSAMSRFNISQRERHLKVAKVILAYIKTF